MAYQRRRAARRRRRGGDRGPLFRAISTAAICVCVFAALTLFFRVKVIHVTGLNRYTVEQIREAAGVSEGNNLFLLNKYAMADRVMRELPYVEDIHIHRDLPDTLNIDLRECVAPLAIVQDGTAYLISSTGKIVDQIAPSDAQRQGIASVTGCRLLSPTTGTRIAFGSEGSRAQESLLSLLAALRESGKLEEVDGIRLEPSCVKVDWAGRFTLKMEYDADYAFKLYAVDQYLLDGQIQENMTGTFDLTRDDKNYFRQNVR